MDPRIHACLLALPTLVACAIHSPVAAQTQHVYVQQPTNTSCETAIPICDDFVLHYEEIVWGSCLWFRVDVLEEEQLHFTTSGLNRFFISANDPAACACPSSGGTTSMAYNVNTQPGAYYIIARVPGDQGAPGQFSIDIIQGLGCPETPCDDCLPGMALDPDSDYIVSAWVLREDAPFGTVDYGDLGTPPSVVIEAPPGTQIAQFFPSISQPVIEGWQLIEGRFAMADAETFSLFLEAGDGSALFDDVRLFPADGSMKCYVYDPENLRFVAELDERHFATLYEYDNEGRLVRVKKETERGIMTIQETRTNSSHTP